MNIQKCRFCNSKSIRKFFTFEDFPLAPRSTKTPILDKMDFELGVCRHCDLIQKTSKSFTEVLYAEFKNDIVGGKLIKQKQSFYNFIQTQIKPNQKVVEMGSGNGEIIEKLAKNNPTVSFIANDFNLTLNRNFDNLEKLDGDIHQYKFKDIDIFFSSHVFEHIENVREHISRVYEFLKVGGQYIIALPLFERWLRDKNLNLFSQEHPIYPFQSDLNDLFFSFGFRKMISKEFLDHSLFIVYEKMERSAKSNMKLSSTKDPLKHKYITDFFSYVDQIQQLITEVVSKHGRVAIWGANTSTQVLISLLSSSKVEFKNLMIVDNSELKIGGFLFGTEFLIQSPKVITKLTSYDAVIVMLGVFDDEVIEQCKGLNSMVKIYSKSDLLENQTP